MGSYGYNAIIIQFSVLTLLPAVELNHWDNIDIIPAMTGINCVKISENQIFMIFDKDGSYGVKNNMFQWFYII